MNEHEPMEERGARLGRATEAIRARDALTDEVMAAIAAAPASSARTVPVLAALRRAGPAAIVVAALTAAASVALAVNVDHAVDEGGVAGLTAEGGF